MAADIAVAAAKSSLDDLTRSLVTEFNEAHRFGVDLNGDHGKDFFSLDAIEITKISARESTSQLRVEGTLTKRMGETLSVSYQAAKDNWLITDSHGKPLTEFIGSVGGVCEKLTCF